jgi:hypothetical protein
VVYVQSYGFVGTVLGIGSDEPAFVLHGAMNYRKKEEQQGLPAS